jgi:hypothetical protein
MRGANENIELRRAGHGVMPRPEQKNEPGDIEIREEEQDRK